MQEGFLGRTNRQFNQNWWQLRAEPSHSFEELVHAVRATESPIDLSFQPALFGPKLRGATNPILVQFGFDLENAIDEDHATDLTQATLIQTLSSIGQECLDFFILKVRKPLEEFQVNGALAAMDAAKTDGHIRYLGLASSANPITTLGLWQFHDAFDVILFPSSAWDADSDETLSPLAQTRRVGEVRTHVFSGPYGLPLDLVLSTEQLATVLLEQQAKGPHSRTRLIPVSNPEQVRAFSAENPIPVGSPIPDLTADSFWDNLPRQFAGSSSWSIIKRAIIRRTQTLQLVSSTGDRP